MAFISAATCCSVTPSRISPLNRSMASSFNLDAKIIFSFSSSSFTRRALSTHSEAFLKPLPAPSSISSSKNRAAIFLSIPRSLSWFVYPAMISHPGSVSENQTFSMPMSPSTVNSLLINNL